MGIYGDGRGALGHSHALVVVVIVVVVVAVVTVFFIVSFAAGLGLK